jgi:uncharacterized protein YbaR (Trm112 family)
MSLDPALRAILVCPADHGDLADVPAGDGGPEAGLRCQDCGRRYPIRDGIPIMLIDEATEGPSEDDGASAG